MDKYPVYFDRIKDRPLKQETEEEKIYRLELHEQSRSRKEKWLAESQERPGIPGRSILLSDRKNPPKIISKSILKEWLENLDSELYYYDDIRFLSGSAGYHLKKSDGTHLTQRTMVS